MGNCEMGVEKKINSLYSVLKQTDFRVVREVEDLELDSRKTEHTHVPLGKFSARGYGFLSAKMAALDYHNPEL